MPTRLLAQTSESFKGVLITLSQLDNRASENLQALLSSDLIQSRKRPSLKRIVDIASVNQSGP